ncbi:MAG: cation-binding protein [Candidatus Heimdallarchaeota archaeon]|nr:cation-binding protein [Candidatus Heimdallarchaeota archaeon]
MVLPIGPLMIEHRLIERMIIQMNNELEKIKKTKKVDPNFIDMAVDFIRIYADRCHHGKEEDILFRDLKKKKMNKELQNVMNELIEEHKWARKTTKKLVKAKEAYVAGKIEATETVIELLQKLTTFYPKHIEKEDKHFFKPVMEYFTPEEQEQMLQEEYDFDKQFIHQVYEDKVKQLEKRNH